MEIHAGAEWLWRKVGLDYVHGGPVLLASLGSLVAVFVTAALIESVAVGWRASSLGRLMSGRASPRCDMVTALLFQTPLVGHVAVLLSGGLSLWALHCAKIGLHPIWTGGRSPWLHAVVCLVVLDLSYYGVHRLMHAWEPLWQLHRFHHVADEATLLTALRVHPLESALCGVCLAVPIGLLGGTASEGPVVFFLTQVLSMLRHGNLPWSWGKLGDYGLISPAAHRVHHASDPACFDSNFGILFPWWDRLFGTWHAPVAGLPPIGVDGDCLAAMGWARGVWQSYVDFWRALVRLARRPGNASSKIVRSVTTADRPASTATPSPGSDETRRELPVPSVRR
ncbi:MAG TPA: sterol desaturase family protein [Oscillatoriaceae cyanobacterium]